MALIVVGSVKGGAGKSTVASNLLAAIAQRTGSWRQLGDATRLVGLDCDQQGSLTSWSDGRAELGLDPIEIQQILMVGSGPAALRGFQQRVSTVVEAAELVIADCGGFDSPSLRQLLTMANLVVIPVDPSNFGKKGFEAMLEVVANSQAGNPNLKALVVGSQTPPNRGSTAKAQLVADLGEAEDDLANLGIQVASGVISSLKAFMDSNEGRSVLEMGASASRAKAEVRDLAESVFGELFDVEA